MDLPKPPEDNDLKNIIDKLANFVARNGPDFENMTKQKQKDNPKFSFLFGGEYFNYYQYKVTTEQAILNQQKKLASQQQPPPQSLPGPQVPLPVPGANLGPPSVSPGLGPPPVSQGLGPPPVSQGLGPPPVSQGLGPPPVSQGLGPPPVSQGLGPPPVSQQPLGQPPHPWQQPSLPVAQTPQVEQLQQLRNLQEQLAQQTAQTQEQVKQSEANLTAQYQSLIQRQQLQIDEAIHQKKEEEMVKLCENCSVNMEELNQMAQPIIDSCTKDAISTGKNWIFAHNANEKSSILTAQYLLRRITAKESPFELKLHLIYLINDVLHHCQRKNAEDLKNALESVVVPIFCTAHVGVEEDKQTKLNKLLTLWENNKYFKPEIMLQMKDPVAAVSNYQASLITDNADVVTQITSDIQMRYTSLQKQHQEFTNHLNAQLIPLQQQVVAQQQLLQQGPSPCLPSDTETTGPAAVVSMGGPPPVGTTSIMSTASSMGMTASVAPPTMSQPVLSTGLGGGVPAVGPPGIAPGVQPSGGVPPFPPPNFNQPPPNFNQPPPGFPHGPQPFITSEKGIATLDYNHGQPPPVAPAHSTGVPGPAIQLPDLSKPPPGFPNVPQGPPQGPPPPTEADLTPTVPYHELPAGLMAPLVKLEDCDYRALDPKDIRLPPPMPPSERLLAAVEAFYSPPSHDRPRDAEGWEKLGLYEFFKAKQKAKRLKEDEQRRSGHRGRSRSRSPQKRRRYNSGPRSRSRSRSKSPVPYQRASRSKSRSRSRSRSKSRSRSRSRSRSKSKSRSPTPEPSFGQVPFYCASMETRIGSENKGHQLLKKMGWGGGGLGSSEQGIVNPVQQAEVRDKVDMYKGIGMSNNDPFEQFRKSKSQGFIQRMRARVEEPVSATSASSSTPPKS